MIPVVDIRNHYIQPNFIALIQEKIHPTALDSFTFSMVFKAMIEIGYKVKRTIVYE